jgi:sigma-B regulation protein RsbU (phosphoserine phosphatase)
VFLITDGDSAGEALGRRLGPGWASIIATDSASVPEALGADLVLVDVPPGRPDAVERASAVAARLSGWPIPVAAVAAQLDRDQRIALYRAGVLAILAPDEDGEELSARLGCLLAAKRAARLDGRASPAVRRLQQHTRRLDEQLRLAQRIQMDFLPRRMPELAGTRFAARLEPAAWVSGDFYDVFRLDERHVGFYVADAVGHGIPAALLTVFVKMGLQAKRIEGRRYELLGPDESLRLLNADLLSADLKESPFVTMVYGVYDAPARDLVYARAGHPRPVLLDPSGSVRPLEGEGPLLGVFPDVTFERRSIRLEKGQRVVLYSDGAEHLAAGPPDGQERLLECLRAGALLPLEAMLDEVLDAVHAAAAGRRLLDDVTLLALEVGDEPAP